MDENSSSSWDLVTEFEIKAEKIECMDIQPEPQIENSLSEVRIIPMVPNFLTEVKTEPELEPVLMENATVVEETKM